MSENRKYFEINSRLGGNPFLDNPILNDKFFELKTEIDEFKVLDLKWVKRSKFKIDHKDNNYYIIMLVDGKFFDSLIPFNQGNYLSKVLPGFEDSKELDPYSVDDCKNFATYGKMINFDFNPECKNQLIILEIKDPDLETKSRLSFLESCDYIILGTPRFRSKNEAYLRTLDLVRKGVGKEYSYEAEALDTINPDMYQLDFGIKEYELKKSKLIDNFVYSFLFGEFEYLSRRQRIEILINLNELLDLERFMTDTEMLSKLKLICKVTPKDILIRHVKEKIKGHYGLKNEYDALDLSSLTRKQYKELYSVASNFLKLRFK